MAREKRGSRGKKKTRRSGAARPRPTRKPPQRPQTKKRTPRRGDRRKRRTPAPKPKPTRVKKRPVSAPKKRASRVTKVRKPALWELKLEDKVVYRDRSGRKVPKGTPGAKKSVYTWGKDTVSGRKRLVAKVEPGFIQKIGSVDMDGPEMGRIDAALVKSSATQAIGMRSTQMVEFTIKARDHRGKDHRFKISFNLGEVRRRRKLYRAVVGRILEELRRRGYRTNYTLELFKAARLKGLKYQITWQDWRKLDVLHDMEITVTIFN